MIAGEFSLSELKEVDGTKYHLGRCISGTVYNNSILCYPENLEPVFEIIAMRRANYYLKELPLGMTCGMYVEVLDNSVYDFDITKGVTLVAVKSESL